MSSLEADLAWLALSEEALLFDDALVQQKFNDLDAAQRAEEFEPVATAHEADAAPSDEREQARLALPDLSNLVLMSLFALTYPAAARADAARSGPRPEPAGALPR